MHHKTLVHGPRRQISFTMLDVCSSTMWRHICSGFAASFCLITTDTPRAVAASWLSEITKVYHEAAARDNFPLTRICDCDHGRIMSAMGWGLCTVSLQNPANLYLLTVHSIHSLSVVNWEQSKVKVQAVQALGLLEVQDSTLYKGWVSPGAWCGWKNEVYTYYISVALVRERTIPTERSLFVGEVSVNFCG
jgi:hypothetical protein